MTRLRLFYFFYFGAMASSMPFYALHYRERGLTAPQIGILIALPPLITLVAAPVWSALADATRRHKTVLLITTTGTFLSVAGIMVTPTFAGLLPVVVLYALFFAPILPLVDHTVLATLGVQKENYGRQRLLGSFGPALAGPLVAALVGRFGLRVSFYATLACFATLLLLFARIEIRVGELSGAFRKELRSLLVNPRLGRFLLVVFLGMAGYSALMTYVYVTMVELGAPKSLMGFALTVGSIGEIPFLLYSTRLLRRFGARGMLTTSLIAMIIVLFGVSMAKSPWLVLALQLLHGTAFSGMAISGVAYAGEVAPPGMGATAQGLFGAVFGGLAFAVGVFASSVLWDQWGSATMYRMAGTLALLGLAVFLITARRDRLSS